MRTDNLDIGPNLPDSRKLNYVDLEAFESLEEDLAQSSILTNSSFNRTELEAAAKADLNVLAALALPDIFEFDFPPLLEAMFERAVEGLEKLDQFEQLAYGIPRGFSKTTIVKILVLYCVLFIPEVDFIFIVGATASKAEDILTDVKGMLNAPNIKAVFGDWSIYAQTDNNDTKNFIFRGRPIVIKAAGAGTSVRGLNLNNNRPKFMIFDDIQTKECSESAEQSKGLIQWMVGTAMKAKSPKGCCFLFVANMYPTPNSILKQLKLNSTWIKFISGAILANGESIWPELRSKESLYKELDNDIAMGCADTFLSEVMNDTEISRNTTVDFSKLKKWEWLESEEPQGKFIVIDPSQGKGKDFDAIGMFEVYDEICACRHLIVEHLAPSNLIKQVLILALQTGARLIAVESYAYQYTLLHWFDVLCKQFGITGIVFVSITGGTKSKNARIAVGIKELQAGKVVLHPSVANKVHQQIADFNPLKTNNVDDVLDVISYAPKVLADYGPDCLSGAELAVQEESMGVDSDFSVLNYKG